jgi:hypothetical protein
VWRHRVEIALSCAIVVSVAQLFAPAPACAQAWVPTRGDGAVAIVYQNQFVDQHTLDDGARIDRGETRTHIMAVDLTYGLTNRVALNVGLPFIASKYSGVNPHTEAAFGRTSVLDFDGYHATTQDFRVDLRYSAVRGATAVTPYVSGVIPSRSYDYFGHAAAGRRLAEVQIGAYVGRMLDPVLPGGFIQARYSYGFTQRLLGVQHDRSVSEVEIGYFVRPNVRVFALSFGQISHGGIRFAPNFPAGLTSDELLYHDRFSRVNSLDFGGGAQVSLSPSVDLFGSLVHNEIQTNGHALKYSVTTGLSWSFHHGSPGTGASASRQAALVKCLCQKGE